MKKRSRVSDLTQKNVDIIAKMEKAFQDQRTFGERVADRFAAVIGSWTFIITQTVLLMVWMAVNVVAWFYHWDPYPFILLNLALSFQAAYATPVIMMSQNRQSRFSERRNHLDLQINLLAEQETTEILRLLQRLCEKAGVSVEGEPSLKALEQATNPEKVAHQIENLVESHCADDGAQGK
jgi:uncharacterized membrane protein